MNFEGLLQCAKVAFFLAHSQTKVLFETYFERPHKKEVHIVN